jgi:hypothetical protein
MNLKRVFPAFGFHYSAQGATWAATLRSRASESCDRYGVSKRI